MIVKQTNISGVADLMYTICEAYPLGQGYNVKPKGNLFIAFWLICSRSENYRIIP